MAFESGHQKEGGRQSGGKNKNTLILETFAQSIIEGGMERFQEELNKLSGKDYINAYLTLFEFVKPKLARSEVNKMPDRDHLNTVIFKLVSPDNTGVDLEAMKPENLQYT